MESADAHFVQKEPCPKCGSRDNLARYSDGHGYCFGCEHYEPSPDAEANQDKAVSEKRQQEFLSGKPMAISKRSLHEETCRKFGYTVGRHHDKPVQIASYRRDGRIAAQKVRYPGKDFSVRGNLKEAGLFGQHLWQGGRRVVVTEGEIDCLSVAQAQGNKWPVVSIPNGAHGAKKALARELEWLEQFDEVVLMFDMDEPGQDAARECVALFTPGKCKIAHLPLKDPNEMLKAGRGEEIIRAIFNARLYRPDGIVTFGDIRELALAQVAQGLPWWLPELNELTYGRRYGEVYAFGAGTGVGKTDWFTQEIVNTAITLNEKVAAFYLEQPPAETGKRVAGKLAGKRFHVPDGTWTQDELVEAFDRIEATGSVFLYDSFGSTEWDVIKAKMKYLVHTEGVKHVFLDHLTALAAAEEDEKKALERIMAEIAGFAQEHNVCFYFISHLATPEGKPHEEGGRVMIRHFKGSRAIGFWSHFMFGLERNQQAEDEVERQTTIFRCLKDRLSGQATGKVIRLGYDAIKGFLFPKPEPSFQDSPDESWPSTGTDDF